MALSSVTTAPLSDESLAFGELSLNITSGSQSHVINAVYTQKPTELGPEWNFINVLSAAQALLVDFLPITWQPAVDEFGKGGTAELREALVSLQMTFAFKRIRPRYQHALNNTWREQCRRAAFRALMSEITVLGHPRIRNHPHISALQGLSWDIESDDEVWPVLVSEKTLLGDMEKFLLSEPGNSLSRRDRIRLCLEVAIGIRDLHRLGQSCFTAGLI